MNDDKIEELLVHGCGFTKPEGFKEDVYLTPGGFMEVEKDNTRFYLKKIDKVEIVI